jgi:transcriptional regulator with XRE-family HTH domain
VRKRLGISQRELAKRSGVSRQQLRNIEEGRRTTLETLETLANTLRVSSEMLRSEEPPESTGSSFEIGAEGAGAVEEGYLDHFAGGEHVDHFYEHDIAEAYLRIFKAEGSSDEAFKLAIRRALSLGKSRGKELA